MLTFIVAIELRKLTQIVLFGCFSVIFTSFTLTLVCVDQSTSSHEIPIIEVNIICI